MWGGGRSFLADFAFCAPDLAGAHRRLTKVGQRVAMIVKVSCYIGQTLSNYLTDSQIALGERQTTDSGPPRRRTHFATPTEPRCHTLDTCAKAIDSPLELLEIHLRLNS